MLKNCVIISRSNWKPKDFKNLKRFAVQDCALNFQGLIYKPFNEACFEEYTALDMELRFNSRFDPLDWPSRHPTRKRFEGCKVMRLRGTIQSETVLEMLKSLVGGFFKSLHLLHAETTLPPTKFVI
jgi:hypothetical protein